MFGQWLREQREAAGLTRKQLGDAAGIAASTVQQIERGAIKRPPNKRLAGFSRLLDIPFNTFLEELGEQPVEVEQSHRPGCTPSYMIKMDEKKQESRTILEELTDIPGPKLMSAMTNEEYLQAIGA